jgi:hypothetical protein
MSHITDKANPGSVSTSQYHLPPSTLIVPIPNLSASVVEKKGSGKPQQPLTSGGMKDVSFPFFIVKK